MSQLTVPPARAPVRPRVLRHGYTAPRLLEEEIAELLAAGRRAVVHVYGARGLGKTTALAHLAATLADEARLRLRDDRLTVEPGAALVTVLASRSHEVTADVRFELLPWTDDEVLEYLGAVHGDRIAAAFAAWRNGTDHDLGRWPGTCRRVLDVLATEPGVGDPLTALAIVLHQQLGPRYAAAADLALRTFVAPGTSRDPQEPGQPAILTAERHLLGSSTVLASLAAEGVISVALQQPRGIRVQLAWSAPLRTAVGHALRSDADVAARLLARAGSCRLRHKAVVLSALCATWPPYRPARPPRGDLRHAWLRGIDLGGMRVRAQLQRADLVVADLRGAHFDRCNLAHANLHGARAAHAKLSALHAPFLLAPGLDAPGSCWPAAELRHSNFRTARLDGAFLRGAQLDHSRLEGASLRSADLEYASLGRVVLADADLQDAHCDGAHFEDVDLRTTRLVGASCRAAWFVRCNFAGTELPGFAAPAARFLGSDLTGARWHGARLTGASFEQAGLADVDWEGADLRRCDFHRATFHLGNSRSGLVDSPIASEGSRTGFYTDQSLEDRFQAPEDVRKANLRNCDLRGAQISDTDFYLVDVRGALLDREQRIWLRRCRAILDPE